MIRPDVVEALFLAALNGMEKKAEELEATRSEIFSAGATIGSRTLVAAVNMKMDTEGVREALTKLWERLPPTPKAEVQ